MASTFAGLLWKCWAATGLTNGLFVGVPNLYYGLSQAYYATKHSCVCISFEFAETLLIATIKTGYYMGLGPIGTSRIGLAMYNYKVSGDVKWLEVLVKPRILSTCNYHEYTMWPLGIASWKPL